MGLKPHVRISREEREVVSEEGQARHERLLRLFTGELGELVTGFMLEGPSGSQQIMVEAYFAWYTDGHERWIDFVRLVEGFRFDGPAAAADAQRFAILPGEARGVFMVTVADTDDHLGERTIDEIALNAATHVALSHDIPLAIIAYCRVVDGGQEKTMFWYPTATIPDRLLSLFLDKIRGVYLA